MKKIAIPTRDNVVDDHFGHCQFYTIFTIGAKNNIEKLEMLPSPEGCGCKSNIASVFQQMNVTVMLAGNMGNGALNILSAHGITVFRGCSGDVQKLLKPICPEPSTIRVKAAIIMLLIINAAINHSFRLH